MPRAWRPAARRARAQTNAQLTAHAPPHRRRYNALAIPIAAGALWPLTHALMPPWVAALAMALSSVSVVASSLALRFYRPPPRPTL